MEIREGPEGLNRGDAARPNVLAPEQLLEAEQDGIIGRAGEQAQELALAFEQAADGSGYREHKVAMGYPLEALLDQLLCEQGRALGLA